MRALILVLAAGCTEKVDLGAADGIPGLVALDVSPPDEMISFDRVSPPAQHVAYTAIGRFIDGHTEDVTERIQWTTTTPYPGRFDVPGDYTATGEAVGRVGIRAISGPIEGDATLTIEMTAVFVDQVFGLPPNPNVFDGSSGVVDVSKAPVISYPASETRFPQEIQPIVLQQKIGVTSDTMRLRFDSELLHLSVITTSDRFQDESIWKLVAGSHPGTSVDYTVDGISSTSSTYFSGETIALHFSPGPTTDAIYFFSSQPGVVVRGATADASGVSIIDVGSADPHLAVTRDGRLVVLEEGDKLEAFDLVSLERLATPPQSMGFATFSPDGTRMLVANRGVLTLRDPATGAQIGGTIDLGNNRKGTHPDWSPDGRYIVFTLSTMIPDNTEVKQGSIARLEVTGDSFGPPDILVASIGGDTDNNFAPRWGPNNLIAYVHAESGAKDPRVAELHLIADGTVEPGSIEQVRLPLASLRTGIVDVVDTEVVTPSWTIGSDGAAWLAFSSTRPYGVIREMTGTSQIWIAGIDPAKPTDPSYAAFRLSCQELSPANSGATWAPVPSPGDTE